jgi:hypothetical protein
MFIKLQKPSSLEVLAIIDCYYCRYILLNVLSAFPLAWPQERSLSSELGLRTVVDGIRVLLFLEPKLLTDSEGYKAPYILHFFFHETA